MAAKWQDTLIIEAWGDKKILYLSLYNYYITKQ